MEIEKSNSRQEAAASPMNKWCSKFLWHRSVVECPAFAVTEIGMEERREGIEVEIDVFVVAAAWGMDNLISISQIEWGQQRDRFDPIHREAANESEMRMMEEEKKKEKQK